MPAKTAARPCQSCPRMIYRQAVATGRDCGLCKLQVRALAMPARTVDPPMFAIWRKWFAMREEEIQ